MPIGIVDGCGVESRLTARHKIVNLAHSEDLDMDRKEEIARKMLEHFLQRPFRDEDPISLEEFEAVDGLLTFEVDAVTCYDGPMTARDLIEQLVSEGSIGRMRTWAANHGV